MDSPSLFVTLSPQWQTLALYALLAAIAIMVIARLPYIGRVFRLLMALALLGFGIFVMLQHAPYQPALARLTERLGLDGQQVVGSEVRIRMAPNGHFWADAEINGVRRRMLVDSGATITALSARTAAEASVDINTDLLPVVLQTANGLAQARTGTVETLRIGNIEARDLRVISSPALGQMDVLGMNFLSNLASWRIEGRTLILVPEQPGAR